jgi:hypothetical protein
VTFRVEAVAAARRKIDAAGLSPLGGGRSYAGPHLRSEMWDRRARRLICSFFNCMGVVNRGAVEYGPRVEPIHVCGARMRHGWASGDEGLVKVNSTKWSLLATSGIYSSRSTGTPALRFLFFLPTELPRRRRTHPPSSPTFNCGQPVRAQAYCGRTIRAQRTDPGTVGNSVY